MWSTQCNFSIKCQTLNKANHVNKHFKYNDNLFQLCYNSCSHRFTEGELILIENVMSLLVLNLICSPSFQNMRIDPEKS